jgi:hypothetical protein
LVLFICFIEYFYMPPTDFTVSEDARIGPRNVATLALDFLSI